MTTRRLLGAVFTYVVSLMSATIVWNFLVDVGLVEQSVSRLPFLLVVFIGANAFIVGGIVYLDARSRRIARRHPDYDKMTKLGGYKAHGYVDKDGKEYVAFTPRRKKDPNWGKDKND